MGKINTTTTGTTTTPTNDEIEDEFDEEFDQSHSSSSSSTSNNNNNDNKHRQEQEQKQQLLLNYVLGHVHSNILLVPYGPGIHLINHHATQYNAKLRWSTTTTTTNQRPKHRPSWILDPDQITLSQLIEEQPGGKLVLELFALRDIEPGEEILIHNGISI